MRIFNSNGARIFYIATYERKSFTNKVISWSYYFYNLFSWKLNVSTSFFRIKKVLDEICCELSKGILFHRKCEKTTNGEKAEARFHRLSHLMATKLSVTFLRRLLDSNIIMSSVIKLKNVLKDELCDATLYLSHKTLHKQILDSLTIDSDSA